jgi:predicted O-methyltransferase YrrM
VDDPRWSQVDGYVTQTLLGHDEALQRALVAAQEAQLPPIAVTAPQGKLLQLIAQIHGARRILELGTLGGYSTIWLARALPKGGQLVSLEVDERCVQTAKASIDAAGLADRVEVLLGPGLQTLQRLHDEGVEPFDLVFIDADKQTTPEYFQWALKLTRPRAVIVTDNVVRAGELADPHSTDPRVQGMRRFHQLLAAEPRASATTIQTVGEKGYDGFTLVLLDAEASDELRRRLPSEQ